MATGDTRAAISLRFSSGPYPPLAGEGRAAARGEVYLHPTTRGSSPTASGSTGKVDALRSAPHSAQAPS